MCRNIAFLLQYREDNSIGLCVSIQSQRVAYIFLRNAVDFLSAVSFLTSLFDLIIVIIIIIYCYYYLLLLLFIVIIIYCYYYLLLLFIIIIIITIIIITIIIYYYYYYYYYLLLLFIVIIIYCYLLLLLFIVINYWRLLVSSFILKFLWVGGDVPEVASERIDFYIRPIRSAGGAGREGAGRSVYGQRRSRRLGHVHL